MKSNRLKINCDKSECMWMCTKATKEFVFQVGGSVIQPTDGDSNLGVFCTIISISKKHVSNVRRSCYFQLRQLRVVRRSLPSGVLRSLLHAFVSCRLDYCNSLMIGLPICYLKRLHTVQERCSTSLRRRVKTKQCSSSYLR